MSILWRPQMSVGNDLIDTEHKYLLCLVNTLELAIHTDAELETVQQILEQLFDYTKTHFAHEEKLQLRVKYPLYHEHKVEHQNILDDLVRARDHFLDSLRRRERAAETASTPSEPPEGDSGDTRPPEALPEGGVSDDEFMAMLAEDEPEAAPAEGSTDGGESDENYAELVVLIRKWIVDHVLQSDLKMKKYLARLPQAAMG